MQYFSLQRFASKRRKPLQIPSEKPVPGFLLGRLSAGALRHGRKIENISDAIFFTQELVPRDGPGSFNPIGEIAFANFSSGAAPASGIIRKIKKVKIFCLTNTGCIVTIAQVWKKS